MDVDDEPRIGGEDDPMRLPPSSSPAMSSSTASSTAGSSPAEDYPPPFKFALQLTFSSYHSTYEHGKPRRVTVKQRVAGVHAKVKRSVYIESM
jgi:hypothetical protein